MLGNFVKFVNHFLNAFFVSGILDFNDCFTTTWNFSMNTIDFWAKFVVHFFLITLLSTTLLSFLKSPETSISLSISNLTSLI